MKKVTIIDYGLGNILSVKRAFEYSGAEVSITDIPSDIINADMLVLPGVGAFRDGMAGLAHKDLIEPIKKYCKLNKPFLGICLGMQMMLDESEEFGRHEGLGVIKGKVVRITDMNCEGEKQKVPYVGWSELLAAEGSDISIWDHTIMKQVKKGDSVYFVHSYHALPYDKSHVFAVYKYGGVPITAVIKKGNLYGCQFHPEKSGEVGLSIIREFIKLDAR
ncbi:MAG: imidazole glycerol phosphate synthase subunit HisH [Bacillota bacterium]